MTFDSKIAKLKGLNVYFTGGDFQRDIQVVCAMGLSAAIRDRVENTGISAKGNTFKGYSTKPTLVGASSFYNQGPKNMLFGTKEKRKELMWITIKGNGKNYRLAIMPGGYKEIKRLDGGRTNYRDFRRTGEMWLGYGIKASKGKNTVVVGGRKEESQNKINWNSAQMKINIIAASQIEIDNYNKLMNRMINKKYNDTINN
ncbi:MAG: hypothetical protein PHU98_06130 [Mariniphaga sp.]|nr:hypothetical protein [Paludibacter sp.]MDD4225948.1 hypothetical protein [Mariniphaga sp.]